MGKGKGEGGGRGLRVCANRYHSSPPPPLPNLVDDGEIELRKDALRLFGRKAENKFANDLEGEDAKLLRNLDGLAASYVLVQLGRQTVHRPLGHALRIE